MKKTLLLMGLLALEMSGNVALAGVRDGEPLSWKREGLRKQSETPADADEEPAEETAPPSSERRGLRRESSR